MIFTVAISNSSVINFSLHSPPETTTSLKENPVGQVMQKVVNAKWITAFVIYAERNNEHSSFCILS